MNFGQIGLLVMTIVLLLGAAIPVYRKNVQPSKSRLVKQLFCIGILLGIVFSVLLIFLSAQYSFVHTYTSWGVGIVLLCFSIVYIAMRIVYRGKK